MSGWLSERHLDHEAAWLARHVAWFGAFDADRTVADARTCLSNGLPAAALCTGEGVDPALGDNPHYLVFRAAVLEAAGDARNAVVRLKQQSGSIRPRPACRRRGVVCCWQWDAAGQRSRPA